MKALHTTPYAQRMIATGSYERALTAVADLERQVQADLDLDGGGIRWMQGQVDWQRSCLIGDYFFAAMQGVRLSLEAAQFARKRSQQKRFSDNQWLRARWDGLRRTPGKTPEDFLTAVYQRNQLEAERELEIHLSAEHCLFHLAQALDRAAACLVVAGAFRLPLLQLDWGKLAAMAAKGAEPGHRLRIQSRAGREQQAATLALIKKEPEAHGPKDWLPWLIRTRNTLTHRAPQTKIALVLEDRGAPSGLTWPFHRQPGWAELEAFMKTAGGEGLNQILLDDDPQSTLDGLFTSTCSLLSVLIEHVVQLSALRRTDPSLLVQTGGQWPGYFDQPVLHFAGYGNSPKVQRGEGLSFNISSVGSLRAQAFRLGDRWASAWRGDD